MSWITLGEDKGKILLTSKDSTSGMLPKGSFLTIEQDDAKFILRVEDSTQRAIYSPSPLVVDMDLSPLQHDQKCKNLIHASRVYSESKRDDGLIDFIRPQAIATRSSQEDIDAALGSDKEGPKVFVATVQYEQNQLISDDAGNYITATLPNDMFFYQTLISGKTGSGKTVAIKYLAQYFAEELDGCVLAINVKDTDLLRMDQPTKTTSPQAQKEWSALNEEPRGVFNYTIYYPATTEISNLKGVNHQKAQKIHLDVSSIEPESLTGLLSRISNIGAMNLPNVFRFWQDRQRRQSDPSNFTFSRFVEYFRAGLNDKLVYKTLNTRQEESEVIFARGTYENILRNLDVAIEFFDNEGALSLTDKEILQPGKLSVVNVAAKHGIQFGSVLLRHLLGQIVRAKSVGNENVPPVLIIIDEVHMFYNSDASSEALGDLDTICRTGRSQEIGVIFASQNPQDLPRGLAPVINTKIFFKSETNLAKSFGISSVELESLRTGFALASIHDFAKLKILKFPLALAGVFEKEQ